VLIVESLLLPRYALVVRVVSALVNGKPKHSLHIYIPILCCIVVSVYCPVSSVGSRALGMEPYIYICVY
jgi:hypothetical protein